MGIMLLAGAGIALVAGTALAQAPSVARGDGVQTRAEVAQRVNGLFKRLDANRDGFVTRDEVDAAHAAMSGQSRNETGERRGNRGMRGGMGLGGRLFEMADVNGDNRVSLQEASTAAASHFDMADLDKDGRITREERQQLREHHMDRSHD